MTEDLLWHALIDDRDRLTDWISRADSLFDRGRMLPNTMERLCVERGRMSLALEETWRLIDGFDRPGV